MKTKVKKVEISEEQRLLENKESQLRDLKIRIDNGSIPKNPTRLFKVGDPVKIGNLENIIVTEVLFDGLAYSIHYDYMGTSYGNAVREIGDGIWDWTSVFPVTSFGKDRGEPIREKDDIRISYANNDISSLLHNVYYSGVDFNPEYQRELVWNMEQKLSLIDSIFANVEIGKFTFIKIDFSKRNSLYYEILDGKQRLTTILEFYEDRFTWRGKKFSELCFQDSHHFTSFPVIQGIVEDITEQQILKLFIKMNTSGTPVSQEHLSKIKSLIK